MTSRARLAAALVVVALALLAGWMSGFGAAPDPLPAGGLRWSEAEVAEPARIDSYVRRVAARGILPNAALRAEEAASASVGQQTADGLATLLSASDLYAFVRRGEVWRIHAYGPQSQTTVYASGDQLADGWVIHRIDPTQVILRRGEDERRLRAFSSGESDDET